MKPDMTTALGIQRKTKKDANFKVTETSEPAWCKSGLIGTGLLNATTFQAMLPSKGCVGFATARIARCLNNMHAWWMMVKGGSQQVCT